MVQKEVGYSAGSEAVAVYASMGSRSQLDTHSSLQVKLLGAGVDGTSVPVRVRSTGTGKDGVRTGPVFLNVNQMTACCSMLHALALCTLHSI